jgi:hypothetical protein
MTENQRHDWTEDELAALEDPEQWDWDHPIVLPPVPDAGARFAVRFNSAEVARLDAAARARGVDILQFIHDAALDAAAARPAARGPRDSG